MKLQQFDQWVIAASRRWFVPTARVAIGLIYVWFGVLKLFDISSASPLATALTAQTIGLEYFATAFRGLAVFEVVLGLIFLFPSATRLVIPLLGLHMLIVCSPLVLVPDLAWTAPFVPSLEGQYIIKNVLIFALAIGIVAHTKPLLSRP